MFPLFQALTYFKITQELLNTSIFCKIEKKKRKKMFWFPKSVTERENLKVIVIED